MSTCNTSGLLIITIITIMIIMIITIMIIIIMVFCDALLVFSTDDVADLYFSLPGTTHSINKYLYLHMYV